MNLSPSPPFTDLSGGGSLAASNGVLYRGRDGSVQEAQEKEEGSEETEGR